MSAPFVLACLLGIGKIRLFSVLVIFVTLWPSLAVAESQGKRRIALVIGNSAYEHVPRLINPGNDARLIASTLQTIGISTVTLDLDLDYAGMQAALSRFAREAAEADWAIIYFAGHGIEKEGTNYLIPTDAKLSSSSHLPNESIHRPLGDIGIDRLRLMGLAIAAVESRLRLRQRKDDARTSQKAPSRAIPIVHSICSNR